MEAQEIIQFIKDAKKETPVKVYIKSSEELSFPNCKVFGCKKNPIVIGEWENIEPLLNQYKDSIQDYFIENDRRNSAIPMLDIKNINARIEPGAIIRDQVHIGDQAVIMMGAIINIGSSIGDKSMIDMGVIMGGRASVGNNCHIGAGTVLAGVIEPASALPVVVEDDVVIGANAVVIEGVRIKKGAVVAAGSIVIDDVEAGMLVAGCPARPIKKVDDKTASKTGIEDALRAL